MNLEAKLNNVLRLSQLEFLKSFHERILNISEVFFPCFLNPSEEAHKELTRFFHSIKGTASTLGFNNLSEIGKEYESFIKSSPTLSITELNRISIGIALILEEYKNININFESIDSDNNSVEPNIINSNSNNKINVLVADDDHSILNFIKKSLQSFDYNIDTVSKPNDVITTLLNGNYDILLLDIIFLDQNGFTIFNEIKTKNIPVKVLFMTGEDILSQAMELSNDVYIKKPIDVMDLVEKIKHYVVKTENTDLQDKEAPMIQNTELYSDAISDKIKILIVDDDDIISNLLSNILKETYDTYIAKDGEMGLDLFRKINPHLTIVDLMLPKIDGFELAKKIKNISNKSKVIVLSAKRREEDIIKSFELGVDDYVSKPFNIQELEVRVKRLIDQ